MTDDLLTTFRSDVPLPDDASAKRAYERAVSGRRRLPQRRLVYALAAVVATGGLAGGLSATLGGASSNVNPERQQIVDQAMTEVQQAFGGDRILKATLDGSLLTIGGKTDEPVNGVVEPFEENVLAHVANDRLRGAGYDGVGTIKGEHTEGSLLPLPSVPQLSADACDIPAGTRLADVTAASGRMIPLLRGFCVIRLTTSDPKNFDFGEVVDQLDAAVPVTKMSRDRGVIIEADDESGVPLVVAAWGASSDQGGPGGALYVRPDLECMTSLVSPPVGRCDSGSANR
jgi:hypothetical protein